MTSSARKIRVPRKGPVAAICRTCRDALAAAAGLRRAGFDPRRIAIVARDYPTRDAVAGLEDWSALAPAWVTIGCLNAIGGGLECLGIPRGGIRRCRSALRADAILVVVQGSPEELERARRACRRS